MCCLQIRTLQVNKYYFGAFSLAYSFVCVVICYVFALVTKQVTTNVRHKGTNKLVMLQVVFDILDKKREEKLYKTMAH